MVWNGSWCCNNPATILQQAEPVNNIVIHPHDCGPCIKPLHPSIYHPCASTSIFHTQFTNPTIHDMPWQHWCTWVYSIPVSVLAYKNGLFIPNLLIQQCIICTGNISTPCFTPLQCLLLVLYLRRMVWFGPWVLIL